MKTMTRRQFGQACAAGIASGIIFSTMAWARQPSVRTVKFPQGGTAPALGMGSWRLAQGRHPISQEEAALGTGLSLGMTLIDTAEMYGSGAAERMISRVIAGKRDSVFLVSKVLPSNAGSASGIRRACANSLERLGTDHLDLYLLHWRGDIGDLGAVVDTFEALKAEGRIRHWGVSNFGVADMKELMSVAGGSACATNQVPYSLVNRRIESDLLPWCEQNGMPIMAYSPLGSGSSGLLRNTVLAKVAARRGVAPAAMAIAWTLRSGRVISIPESGSVEHMRENAAALELVLEKQDIAELDAEFPA